MCKPTCISKGGNVAYVATLLEGKSSFSLFTNRSYVTSSPRSNSADTSRLHCSVLSNSTRHIKETCPSQGDKMTKSLNILRLLPSETILKGQIFNVTDSPSSTSLPSQKGFQKLNEQCEHVSEMDQLSHSIPLSRLSIVIWVWQHSCSEWVTHRLLLIQQA